MTTPKSTPRAYTVKEVSKHGLSLLPYHPETVRDLCRLGPEAGGIRASKAGPGPKAGWLIEEDAIADFLERNIYNPAA